MKMKSLSWQGLCCAEFEFRSNRASYSGFSLENQGILILAFKEEITVCLKFEFDSGNTLHLNHSNTLSL